MRVTLDSKDRWSLASMDDLWQKGKPKKSQGKSLDNTLEPSMPKNMQLKPDWNRIPSKNVAMTDEKFEEAIRSLAFEDAERGMRMGNAGKGIQAGKAVYYKLLNEYISVVSPDRKAAYESFNGKGDVIYGNFNQELLTRGQDGVWNSYHLTKEEMSRMGNFGEIYINAMREYEAEHGQIPYTETATVAPHPYLQWAKSNPSAYPSIYSVLA